MKKEVFKMNCEEFESIGLDAERDASLSGAQRVAAAEHLSSCARCAALQDSWLAARFELRGLAEKTSAVQAPPRVEMRLRQEFRTQHRTLRVRRVAVVSAWALAAAAVLVGAVGWVNWRRSRVEQAAIHQQSQTTTVSSGTKPGSVTPGPEAPVQNAPASRRSGAAKKAGTEALVADNGLSGFTLLPGVFPVDSEDGEILRVRMQRGALGSFGLPVNEERAGEWIQVDLLVGNDGLPEAVRLSR
jgi:anti-sigma factor RsiW